MTQREFMMSQLGSMPSNPDGIVAWAKKRDELLAEYAQKYDENGNERPSPSAAQPAPAPAPAAQPEIKTGGDLSGRRYETAEVTYDAQGRPNSPQFESGRDAQGNLLDALKIKKQDDVTADRSALDALKGRALSEGPSPWAKMMLDKQQMEQAQAGDQAAQATAAQLNSAKSQLAQSGGLGTGSRERLAKQSMQQGLLSQQQVNRQGQLDRANIGLQDEQQKVGLLNQVQTGENQQAGIGMQNRQYSTGVDQANVGNTLMDLNAKRAFNANTYNEAMRAWAAEKSANAQARAAGGGGKK